MKATAKNISLTGVGFLGASLALYAILELWTSWEQARTPGEKNLGVAVLGMTVGVPMLFSAAMGLACLAAGGVMFAYGRLRMRKGPVR